MVASFVRDRISDNDENTRYEVRYNISLIVSMLIILYSSVRCALKRAEKNSTVVSTSKVLLLLRRVR